MMTLPGIGVFGTGNTARVLIQLLRAEGFSIEALWGKTDEDAKVVAEEMGIPFYTSHTDDVLLHQEVDLVCISIPPPLTRQIAVKALGIGKNVICEKAASSLDAFTMVKAARYYPKLMSLVGNALRFLPAFDRMRQLILEQGYVGEIRICDVRVYGGSLLSSNYSWICDDLMGGGGLHTLGTYLVDLLTHLTNKKAEKVHGFLKTFVKQNEAISGIRYVTSDDFCFFQMQMTGGACSTVTLNFNMPGTFVHEVMVVGSAGRLVVRGTELYGQKNSASEEKLLLSEPLTSDIADVSDFDKVPPPYLMGIAHMVKALRQSFQDQEDRRTWDHKPLSVAATFEDGLYMQRVVDAIKRSNRSGEWESVELTNEETDSNQNLSEVIQHNL
ncbi:glucose-fructose oxidoreductase domain-containing protein 2 isoform X1 [Xenopus laevis]|uniref:Glucose-fructose oxidoreductase domain-containing protein 2 n=2 Tax=Xenopus laevis TaxID=8355 RepID=GFOD2_XENLA|nr:glucose-fructose oxidoreductase domain-containing protein 2 precursor [Xenopus laevis]XP_018111913.1 glucose-fructose oxidoreductase domain-containing protein 2 isoform X1 [Xenopus laevis]XP_018111914.1 glucose-fructose oxidoreductase domain-containing protein 2 isoform X1 [Xenopus laevis]Q7ZY75.1 RecName: Full=Glucose-fructose oxidoreductase domain-containing protein 2; Flags: Precursor [Xenopus laevis]AAH43911.1 MGC53910 protein [Xenopus laevis]AAH84383.1 MGC53910 protein [Xenopus laevis]